MPLIRRRRIWWDPVLEVSGYVVYASPDSTVFDPGKFLWEATPGIMFKSVPGKTDLVIPDEWPEFPTAQGTYYIGITSRDEVGNESDPLLSSGQFKFSAPPAPSRGGIDIV
jgi:hypothetical protein